MIVLLNGLQAGNASGTGRYTYELARRLPGRDESIETRVVWPSELGLPPGSKAESFTRRSAKAPGRLAYDQWGIHGEAKALGAEGVHYPANVGSLRSVGRSVVTLHDLSFFRDPSWFPFNRGLYYRYAVARSVRKATRIIVDSRATADDAASILGIEDSRMDVIPLGVGEDFVRADEAAIREVKISYDLPESFFLYVGTLEPRKNLVRLSEAWSSMADMYPMALVIAGRPGWKTEGLRRSLDASPHRERIHLPGPISVEDLPALLSAAYAFVWPSLWEGFGLPPLEAMACGTAVLTSKTSSLPEVVGECAVMVDPESTESIAEGLLRLSRDEKLLDRLQREGPKRASTFSWDRTADLTLETYRKVFSES